jgi:hypothetical protein
MTVNWYKQKAGAKVDEATERLAEALAFRIEERAKINISEAPGASGQGLIDTGFMINSTYVVLPDDSTYVDDTGYQVNQAGQQVWRQMAPEAELEGALAAVAVGAEYAIYQEMIHHFLYQAAEDAASEAGADLEIGEL